VASIKEGLGNSGPPRPEGVGIRGNGDWGLIFLLSTQYSALSRQMLLILIVSAFFIREVMNREQGRWGDREMRDKITQPISNSQFSITHYPLPITHYPFPIPNSHFHNGYLDLGKLLYVQFLAIKNVHPKTDLVCIVSNLKSKQLSGQS
jgi:hypothetical protein